jgi:hypothetical protein
MPSKDIRNNRENQGPKLAWSKPHIEEAPIDDHYRALYQQALAEEPYHPWELGTVITVNLLDPRTITQAMIDEERETAARFEADGHMETAQALYDSANRMELARAGAVKSLHPNKSIFGRLNTSGRDDRRIVTDLTTLNREYALMQCPGLASAWVCQADQMPITDIDLKRRLASQIVLSVAPGGKETRTPAFKFLSEHAGKKIYRRIGFTSKNVKPDCLNLYRGLGIAPKPGKCDRILNHIKDVICRGAEDRYKSMLDLMAWQIQHIGEPSRIIVVLISENQQAGKGILLEETLLKIYDPSGTAPQNTDQITGRFNDILRGMSYIFCDEIFFSGDRKTADAFKRLATTTRMPVEGKGLPIFQYPVGVNLWLASNRENAVHLENGDARYWILEISEHRIGDAEYFDNVMSEINSGGREAFAHYLLTRDVSGFVPHRDIKRDNDEHRKMIILSLNHFSLRVWLMACCHAGLVLGMKIDGITMEWKEQAKLNHSDMYQAYINWQKDVKSPQAPQPTPSNKFGEQLGKAGIQAHKGTGGARQRILPSTEECLKLLNDPSVWKE